MEQESRFGLDGITDYEQLLRPVFFQVFVVKKKFNKNIDCSVRTKKLHKIEVKKYIFVLKYVAYVLKLITYRMNGSFMQINDSLTIHPRSLRPVKQVADFFVLSTIDNLVVTKCFFIFFSKRFLII